MNPSFLVKTALLLLFLRNASAHQSIVYPSPISFQLACRIDNHTNCPGPCPNQKLRKDQNSSDPSTTVERGETIPIHIAKNNHVAGLNRWTVVRVKDMFSHNAHRKGAFLWTCGDANITKCTTRNMERNCRVDRKNEYYRMKIRIPTVYPDGNYVLGWSWYGGATKRGRHGSFGDYYDCMYLRIKGGEKEDNWRPTFDAKGSLTGKDGQCMATTNKLGDCWREPCPGGARRTSLVKPADFIRRRPAPLRWSSYTR